MADGNSKCDSLKTAQVITSWTVAAAMIVSIVCFLILPWSFYSNERSLDLPAFAGQELGVKTRYFLGPWFMYNEKTNLEDIAFYTEWEYGWCSDQGRWFYSNQDYYCSLLISTRALSTIAAVLATLSTLTLCMFYRNTGVLQSTSSLLSGLAGILAIISWSFLHQELNKDYAGSPAEGENIVLRYGSGFYLFAVASGLGTAYALISSLQEDGAQQEEGGRFERKEHRPKQQQQQHEEEFKEVDEDFADVVPVAPETYSL